MLRGGSWNNNTENARCAYRNRNEPDNRNNNVGFRLVASTLFTQDVKTMRPCRNCPMGTSEFLPDRGEEWRSLFPAGSGTIPDRKNNNGPAPSAPALARGLDFQQL